MTKLEIIEVNINIMLTTLYECKDRTMSIHRRYDMDMSSYRKHNHDLKTGQFDDIHYSYSTIRTENDISSYITILKETPIIKPKTISIIQLIDDGTYYFNFVPNSMDSVVVQFGDDYENQVRLQDFLTEEAYFMYNTLYKMPEFDELYGFMSLMHKFRAEFMKYNYIIRGRIPPKLIDMECYDFLEYVRLQ